jgi:hypothetical protein
MSSISRRDFLRQSGRARLAVSFLSIVPQLVETGRAQQADKDSGEFVLITQTGASRQSPPEVAGGTQSSASRNYH